MRRVLVVAPTVELAAQRGSEDLTFSNFNAFKIPQLRGVRDTAPYFHDNSAKTLEAVMVHYKPFFDLATAGALILTPQAVAYMKLLD